jgi:uncharacterized membrane protein YeaQ/YmgE (transglycosylase-associated protein family)
MGILSWILLGLIAGALAKFIMPGKDPGGCLITVILGIVGAVLAGFIGTLLGIGRIESFDIGGILLATIGAILVLIIYRMVKKNR